MSRIVYRGVVCAALASLMWLPGVQAGEPLKVGFIYNSPIGDAGWTFQHDQGRQEMEQALAGKVTTHYVESVTETDVERVLRQFVANGDGLIFTTSFGFMNPTLKVAGTAPGVKFEHASGYKLAANVGVYQARAYEARYLTGMVAGKMTKTNIAGFIASFPIPEVLRGINAFTLGMRSVNPQAKVKVIWVNSWYDPGREREATQALKNQGADVINQFTDSSAPTQAAEELGIYSISVGSDRARFGPDAHLTSVVYTWGRFYTDTVRQVLDGTWRSANIWGGLARHMIDIAPLNPVVPKEVAALVDTARAAIVNGTLQPFQGPINDQSGTLRVAAGSAMSDGDLLKMDWYVDGVQDHSL